MPCSNMSNMIGCWKATSMDGLQNVHRAMGLKEDAVAYMQRNPMTMCICMCSPNTVCFGMEMGHMRHKIWMRINETTCLPMCATGRMAEVCMTCVSDRKMQMMSRMQNFTLEETFEVSGDMMHMQVNVNGTTGSIKMQRMERCPKM